MPLRTYAPGYTLCRLDGDLPAFLNACARAGVPVERAAAGGRCFVRSARLAEAQALAAQKGGVLSPLQACSPGTASGRGWPSGRP